MAPTANQLFKMSGEGIPGDINHRTKVQGENPSLFHSHKDSGINLQVGTQLLKDGVSIQQCYCRPEDEAFFGLEMTMKSPLKLLLKRRVVRGVSQHSLERDFDGGRMPRVND